MILLSRGKDYCAILPLCRQSTFRQPVRQLNAPSRTAGCAVVRRAGLHLVLLGARAVGQPGSGNGAPSAAYSTVKAVRKSQQLPHMCRDIQPVVPPNAVPFGSSVLLKPPTALDLREFFSTSKTVAGVPVGFAGQRAGKLVRHAAVHRARCELARRATHRLFR